IYVILYVLTRLAHQAIKIANLETWDRVLGALLGAAKMTAIVACVCATMASLSLPIFQDWFDRATIAPALARATRTVVSGVPQSYRDRIDDGITQVRTQLQDKAGDAAADVVRGEAARK
ncbi:MAG: CvpA family protein, partial [Planctomycetes bacterium]|nr:CvpA family protein [Planctomycetota bacterium]